MSTEKTLSEFNKLVCEESDSNNTLRKIAHENDMMWARSGGTNFFPCETALPKLPPGQYTIESTLNGLMFSRVLTLTDELIDLPDSAADDVIKQIELFWEKEQHFRSLGCLWKRGILLWGPPGSGKTCTLHMISNKIIQKGGISIFSTNPSTTAAGLAVLRQIEPKTPVVVMLEDIDAILDSHSEAPMLALMDGELQVDNVTFVATTNYPEKLDCRFINRPSRFDIIKKIGMPSAQARTTYLKVKNPRFHNGKFEAELKRWVTKTEGFSVAHLKELIISVEIFEVPLDTAIERLKAMLSYHPTSEDYDRDDDC